MIGVPQFRLRTFFLIFVCAAVGLTVGGSPRSIDPDAGLLGLAAQTPTNWRDGLLAAVSMGMIIGLVQQVLQFNRVRASAPSIDQRFAFAIRFAIVWREIVAGIIFVCLLSKMLIARGLLTLPAQEAVNGHETFPQILWLCCVLIVLTATVIRWKAASDVQRVGAMRCLAIVSAAFVLAVIIYRDLTFISFLVHVATAGVDATIPPHVNRANVFPNHHQEGFRTFWIAFAAVCCALTAAVGLVAINEVPQAAYRRPWRWIAVVTMCICLTGGFAIWYYGWEFHRISPDIASVGPASSWLEFVGGALIVLLLISIGACRLTQMRSKLRSEPDVVLATDMSFFHESSLVIAAILGFVAVYFIQLVQMITAPPVFAFLANSLGESLLYAFCDVLTLIVFGIAVLTAKLAWLRWRRRDSPPDLLLIPMAGRTFCFNWMAIAVLVAVGLPTAAAFAFVMWLGPWWILG
jgi:hypothetical protein